MIDEAGVVNRVMRDADPIHAPRQEE